MVAAHRPSSLRQYESCWKRFQAYLRMVAVERVSEDTVLSFLAWLGNTTNRASATVASHHSALAAPLKFSLGITVRPRALELLLKGLKARRPPATRAAPEWSLHKVLQYLQATSSQPSPAQALQRAAFLLALATGFRASQLAALTRYPRFSHLTDRGTTLVLAPSPTFLAKNETADNLIAPIRIPSLHRDCGPHLLCPVSAFKDYIEATPGADSAHLVYNSATNRPLSARALAALLCRIINLRDPGTAPRAHAIRGLAASLAFLRTHSVTRIQDLGGWASTVSFRRKYLIHTVPSTTCVAMGIRPQPLSAPPSSPSLTHTSSSPVQG